eukprot:15422-Heterococcus_DN1.PRE.1
MELIDVFTRSKGVRRVDLQPVIGWANSVIKKITHTKPGELATALSILGGRRSIELLPGTAVAVSLPMSASVLRTPVYRQHYRQNTVKQCGTTVKLPAHYRDLAILSVQNGSDHGFEYETQHCCEALPRYTVRYRGTTEITTD